jgi:hypothetical protein
MILPYGIKTVLGYKYKQLMYFSYLKRKFGTRFKPRGPGPIAPPELIETEALMYVDELKVRKKPEWYFGSGYREAWTVLTTVEQYGAPVEAMKSVLEFGCGSGRVIRHFRYIEGLRLAGTDANSKPIEWNRKNLSGIEFESYRCRRVRSAGPSARTYARANLICWAAIESPRPENHWAR